MTLPVEQRARFNPGDNIPVYADPGAIEAGRFVIITGKNSRGGYKARHCTAGERASGIAERKVPAVTNGYATVHNSTNINRIGAIAWVESGAAVAFGSLLVSDGVGRAVVAGTGGSAVLATGTVGANNAITWTAADPGADGNAIRIQLRDPAANDASLAVDVDGDDVIVSLATGVAGAITSTAAQVIAAVAEHDTASQMVTAANAAGSSGAGAVVAVALTNLAGGSDPAAEGAIQGRALTAATAAGQYIEVDRGV
jgi:hypothetical protein